LLVNIEYGIIEKNRVTEKSKFPPKCKHGDFLATWGYICGRWATELSSFLKEDEVLWTKGCFANTWRDFVKERIGYIHSFSKLSVSQSLLFALDSVKHSIVSWSIIARFHHSVAWWFSTTVHTLRVGRLNGGRAVYNKSVNDWVGCDRVVGFLGVKYYMLRDILTPSTCSSCPPLESMEALGGHYRNMFAFPRELFDSNEKKCINIFFGFCKKNHQKLRFK
jgi:ribosomal protein S27AE